MSGPFEDQSPGVVILPGSYLVAGLPTPSDQYVGKYARVTDLFGEKTDLVLCSVFGSTYFWQPVRPLWGRSIAVASMTLTPLKTPSLIRFTGNLVANRTLTLDPTGAWPGCQFEIAYEGLLGIFALTIVGLDLGATLAMVAGGRRRVFWDGSAYQQYN